MINGQSPQPRRYLVAIGLLTIVAFGFGFFTGRIAKGPAVRTIDDAVQRLTKSSTPADFSILTDAWNLIQEHYVTQPVDNTKLLQGAVSGLVNSLNDPYSFYLNPKDAGSFEDEINGKFEGIGAELGQKDGHVVVIAPLPDTPAEKAGLKAGDSIISVDGAATKDETLDEVVQHIRGKEGTEVALELQRGSEKLTLKITRQKITVKSVKVSFKTSGTKDIAVVEISSFTQTTGSEFKDAMQQIFLKQPAGIVIDLRNNPGGYLDAAVNVADDFLNDGTVVIEDFGNGKKEVTSATAGAPLAAYRTVILVDGGSASAAEILAGALRDRLHSVIIGQKTFGKGSVQEIEDLPDGSTLKLTIAHWLTPNGTSIDKNGLTPDEEVKPGDNPSPDNDVQLNRALERAAQP